MHPLQRPRRSDNPPDGLPPPLSHPEPAPHWGTHVDREGNIKQKKAEMA